MDVSITLSHKGETHELVFPPESAITDLAAHIATTFHISPPNQKLVVPKLGLLRPPFKDPDMLVSNLAGKKIMLIGTPDAAISALLSVESQALARQTSRAEMAASRRRRNKTLPRPADDKYTFAVIRPLSGLPHPERSLEMLQRLAADPGIRSAMRTHQFNVALLTEMEPLSNMSVDAGGVSRLLGLNRNHGEVIELRLRTDAHDGYRNYADVRRTLCHELAHNVHGPHDDKFWALYKQIKREVETVGTGRVIANGESVDVGRYMSFRDEEGEDGYDDDGGWTGGEFVLGRGEGEVADGMTRREVLARAAEERARREQEERERRAKEERMQDTRGARRAQEES